MLATEIDNEIVLMNLERGNYYGLEGTARLIWEMLETPTRFGDLCARLAKSYSATQAAIEADVTTFLLDLQHEQAITLEQH
jgi:hypothetical protein